MAENGIRMTPYQTLACESMRAATTIPEFHFAPACPCGFSRSISRSTHSPCGDTWNSL